MDFVIGLDISTTATKALVLDRSGVLRATGTSGDPVERPADRGRVPGDPRSGRQGPADPDHRERALTGFTAPKLLWVKRHEPEVWSQVCNVLLPKDYVRYRLTGDFAIDCADGSGTLLFEMARRDWSREVVAERVSSSNGCRASMKDRRSPES